MRGLLPAKRPQLSDRAKTSDTRQSDVVGRGGGEKRWCYVLVRCGGAQVNILRSGDRSLSIVPTTGVADSWTLTVKGSRGNTPAGTGEAADAAAAVVAHSLELKRADLLSLRGMFATAVPWISGWMLHLNPAAFDTDLHVMRKGDDGAAASGVAE